MRNFKRKARSNGFINLVDEIFQPRFFENTINEVERELQRGNPPVNITETDEQFILDVVAAGWSKEDFEIKIEENILSIAASNAKPEACTTKAEDTSDGETKEEIKVSAKDDNCCRAGNKIRHEFTRKNFKRSFKIGDKVDREAISATYLNGILTIKLNKVEEVKPEVKVVSVS